LSEDVILMTDKAHFQQRLQLGGWKSTGAPSAASLQCTCDCLVWSGKLQGHRPLFLLRRRWACSYSHICSLFWNVMELPHTRTELSWSCALDHMVQQDGATAHTARASMEVVQEIFPEHIISVRG
jgi:hypothetical protein